MDTIRPTRMSVPFFDGRLSFDAEWKELADGIGRVLDLDKFSHATITHELEMAVGDYTGARIAVGVDNADDALYLMLRAAGAGPGDEVIVPAFGHPRSAAAVARTDATAVFADVEAGGYTLAPEAARAALTGRTRAILAAHPFCQPADLGALRSIADHAGVLLLEDSLEAFGMRYGDRHVGRTGKAGLLSFSATATVGSLGELAMIITDDVAFGQECLLLRHHGRAGEVPGVKADVSGSAAVSGLNAKVDELQAAVVLARLPHADRRIARRSELAARYTRRLSAVPGVRTPSIAARSASVAPAWHRYVIESDQRDLLLAHLKDVGVEAVVGAPSTPAGRLGDCPVAASADARLIALPLYPDLSFGQIDYVCDQIARFAARSLV